MTIKAKFYCESILHTPNQETVKMRAVTKSDCEENKSFSKWTPFGEFTMSVTNENVFGFFQPGEEYYLDINKA